MVIDRLRKKKEEIRKLKETIAKLTSKKFAEVRNFCIIIIGKCAMQSRERRENEVSFKTKASSY